VYTEWTELGLTEHSIKNGLNRGWMNTEPKNGLKWHWLNSE